MLISTLWYDADGVLHQQTDRGTNRRLMTRETEKELPLGSRIAGVTIITDDNGGVSVEHLRLI